MGRLSAEEAAEIKAQAWEMPPAITVEELLATTRPRVTLIEGLLESAVIALMFGKARAGKSWLAETIAIALATGTPLMGKFVVPAPVSVLVLDQDSPTIDLGQRLQRLGGAGPNLRVLPPDTFLYLDEDLGVARLAANIKRFAAKVVIIDCLASCVSGNFNENSSEDVGKLFNNLKKVGRVYDCAIILLHHMKKGPVGLESSSDIDAIRGSSAIAANIDVMYRVIENGENRFIVRPRSKRVRVTAEPFLAEIHNSDTSWSVQWVRTCHSEDPETEEQLDRIVETVREYGEDGATVKDVTNASAGFFNQLEVRRFLLMALERKLVRRTRERSNRFRFWTLEHVPQRLSF